MSSTVCRMKETLGQTEACPDTACPFWETRGAGLEGRCAFEQLDLRGRPQLAAFLLGIRSELEAADVAEGENEARRLFFQRLNAGGD